MSLKTVSSVELSGNTYPARDAIRRLGGVFDPDRKVWVIDIASHPRNTMRGRSGLDSDLGALSAQGINVRYVY
jgi:hypothetical protein